MSKMERKRWVWIIAKVIQTGKVSVLGIMARFGNLKHSTALSDIKRVMEDYPDLMMYDGQYNRYELRAQLPVRLHQLDFDEVTEMIEREKFE